MSEPRLTDSEIDAAEWNLHNGLLPDVDIIADLRATRTELATLRGVVREFQHVCRDAAWMQDERGGDEAGARLIVDGRAKYIRDRFMTAYRKLIAAAQEATDA